MDNSEKRRIQKHVKRLIRRGRLNGKQIVLFGASGFSKEILKVLTAHGFSASAIVDNDGRKIGSRCLGMTVQWPEEALLPRRDDTDVLFYSPRFYEEITSQLVRMGYDKKRQIHSVSREVNDSLLFFCDAALSRLRGIYWYNKLTRGRSPDCRIFVAPYTGTGDIYLAGLFFNEYLKRNGITDYVFVVVSKACKRVADMFDIKNVVQLRPRFSDDLILLKYMRERELNIITLNDGWLSDPLQWLRGYKGLNFEKMFRYFVFGFDDSVPHQLPPKKDYSRETDELFEKYNLVKGKTVVLSPYSNTLFDLPEDVLAAVVNRCKEQGYTVCTNCAGDEEPVGGTISVFFPLNQAIAFMDAAGYFIGVRSGLCDIISSSSCRKVVLYEKDGLFYRSSQFEYFSLAKMGLCGGALEIEYRDDMKDDVLRAIFDVLTS